MNNELLKNKILESFFKKNNITKCNNIKELFDIKTGKKDANFGSENGVYPFYTCAITPISSETYSYDGKYLILPGNGANVGVTLFYDGKFEAYQRTYLLSVKKEEIIDIKYAYYYFKCYWGDYNSNKMYGAAIPYIRLSNLQDFTIVYPNSLKEQRKIVNKIERIFELIDKKESNDKLKDSLKILLKNKIIDTLLRNEGINQINDKDYPFALKDGWDWKTLLDITTKIVDGDHNPPKGENDFTDYFMLSAINICDNGLNESSNIRYLSKENFELSSKRTNVEKGDILLSIVGTIGKCCIYNSESNITFQRSVSIIKPSKVIYNKYLLYCLKSPFIQKYMNDNSAGAVQRGFYLKQLKELLIPVPPLEEQHRIVEKIEQCFELIEQL